MKLIDGKEVSSVLKKEISAEVQKMINNNERPPKLVAVIVGNDGASLTYVGHKDKACLDVGFVSSIICLDKSITEEQLIEQVKQLNNDDTVDGFIVQLPLPSHISEEKIILAIDPLKDVDGFNPINVGRMVSGFDAFISATPLGIMELLKYYKIETSGKNCVVVGRSNIVGRPMANLLSSKGSYGDATVTMCHSKTENLSEITSKADILIVAIGSREFIKADMVKDGAIVIDVGIHRVADPTKKSGFSLVGDVDYDQVAPKCSMITPVPGGVGPMTIVSLMKNTLMSVKYRK